VFRYVDDFLLIFDNREEQDVARCVINIFYKCSFGLRYTHEEPKEGVLQFLDLSLSLRTNHICWSFSPRSKKGILPYASAHSKIVKRGIALSCLGSALKKSCFHCIKDSFNAQILRLRSSGFPWLVLSEVVHALVKKVNGGVRPKRDVEKKRVVVVPYLHKISHNLKHVAQRYGVPVVFSAPPPQKKMARICSQVHLGLETVSRHKCNKKLVSPFVPCTSGVVYSIPLSCGRAYVGQTGRCINDRLREHNLSLRSNVGGHLPLHCRNCACRPTLENTTIIGRYKEKLTRVIYEAFIIQGLGESCVSQPSVALSQKEISF
ncbi:unnamed protein product, partial [Ixodes hexagonus]